jgi:hypothetical protein
MVAIGFAGFPGFALRVDILERLAARVRAAARLSPTFVLPATLAAEAGLNRAELVAIVEALGYRPAPEAGEATFTRPAQPRQRRAREEPRDKRRRASAGPGASPFAVLAQLKVAP